MLPQVRQFDKWLRRKHLQTTTREHCLNDRKP
jgi:hypothetical protein